MHNLYSSLTQYGVHTHLKSKDEFNSFPYVKWTEETFTYVKYNPRRSVNRWGLSLTSLDGGMSGVPDLDSLHQYNKENNTNLEEKNFDKPTPAFLESKRVQDFLDPYKDYMFRTHILRLDPGGYFPKHRDFKGNNFSSVRLICPLKNPCTFILEDKILEWQESELYFLDTAKVHYLFNATFMPSYWLVVNLHLNEETYSIITDNFRYT